MLRRDSIRITIIGFCLLLGMAGSVGIFFYNGMVDGLRDRGLANFDSYLQIGMNRIEDEIANIRTRTLFLARTPAMGNLVRAHYNGGVDPEDGSTEAELLAQLGTLFVRMAELNKHIYRIRLVGVERNGRELLEATRKGGMISLSPPSALNEIGESSFFREAIGLNPQEIYQSGFEVALAPENSLRGIRSFLRTATPLHNDTGEIFGILVIDVDTFSVMRQLRQSIPSEANIYLLNSRGELISRPPPWDMALEEQKGLSGLDPSLVSTVIEGESDSYSGVVTGKDEREIAIFARKFLLHHDSGEFVLAAMAIPMSVLRESADNIRAQISLIAILFSIFGALLLFAATNRHARPMEALTRAAHQILAGRPLSQINWPESADGPAGKLRDAFVEVITTILNREKANRRDRSQA